jgi:hypothetical protein
MDTMMSINKDAIPYATAVLFRQIEVILDHRFKGKPQWMAPKWTLDNQQARIELQIELDDYQHACKRETPRAANKFTT